ncbi:alpha/beta hydrolase family protein [Granulicoccus phenolivorans]|uniref:alpha/beta hydrolase family protein n=1 Tax=Granulicoccus phenolivorans TaxID=266854 RepID=UPI0004127F67|nr:prolyl oligopeptidase family serine peptidase [Granulicoccus phenolivorans]
MAVAPYGSWRSTITADLLTEGRVGLSSPVFDGQDLYWLESRSTEGGRGSIWRQDSHGQRTEVTPHHFVRSTVHEYGGGDFDADEGVVIFTHFPSNLVHTVRRGEVPIPLTRLGAKRYADFELHTRRGFALAVREDHSDPADIRNTIVRIDLRTGADTVLCHGADFYAGPTLGPDDQLAWCEWDHPAMSWDAARIKVGTLPVAAPYAVRNELTIDGAGTPVSAVHPRWDAAGNLLWLSDRSGYWNFQTWRGGVLQICGGTKAPTREPLHDHRYDFTEPAWQLGPGSYVPLADGRILCTWFEEGVQVIGILADGEVTRLTSQVVSVRGVAANGRSAAVVVGFLDRPVALCRLDLVTGHLSEVRTSVDEYLDRRTLAVPEALRVGENQVRAWFYPPTNPGYAAPAGELPPLRVLTHGGPTGMADCALDLSIQFWTSRGYGVADVNYRGSSGFGRDYRRQLAGQWGIVDVADVLAVAEHLVQTGRVDGRRLVIEGGSAGGYTTLRALTTSDLFRAGISRYGIGDLETLARDTHKFESRYLDGLIGRYPEDRAFYVERSPIHHLDRLHSAMLILQGTEDRVVPPNQAEDMAAAVRAQGLPVALLLFEGEGHGFRRSDSVARALAAEESFCAQVLGHQPADPVPLLPVENLTP